MKKGLDVIEQSDTPVTIATYTGDKKEFRIWHETPYGISKNRVMYNHVDSMGKSILFTVADENEDTVKQFVDTFMAYMKEKGKDVVQETSYEDSREPEKEETVAYYF